MKLLIAILLIFAIFTIINPTFELSKQEVTVRKAPLMDINFAKTEALSYLNDLRSGAGMEKLAINDNLNAAARAHAKYMLINNESGHYEIEGHSGFTGELPVDRALKTGYLSMQVSENVSASSRNADESIDGLFSAIYHRFGFLSTTMNEIGLGIVQDKYNTDKTAFTYLMGNSDLNRLCTMKSFTKVGGYYKGCKDKEHRQKKEDVDRALDYAKQTSPDIIIYPYDEQRAVPPVFYAEEPDPLPDYDVSGFPISVEFNDYFYKDVTLLSFTLSDNDGHSIPVLSMDKKSDINQHLTKYQYAIFPLKRLEYNSKYYAKIEYKIKNEVKEKTWGFYTTRIQDEFYKMDKLYDELTISPNRRYVIYFPPVDAHDLLKDLQFPSGVDIQFLDHNTIRLSLMSEAMSKDIEEFVLDTGTRKLKVIVKR